MSDLPPLPVEQVWLIGCSRCANEGIAYVSNESEARAELAERGWTHDYPRTYCPSCNGEIRH